MWTCSECRNLFNTEDKKYHFNLCKTCYFNVDIVKQYRKGDKRPLPDLDPQEGVYDDRMLIKAGPQLHTAAVCTGSGPCSWGHYGPSGPSGPSGPLGPLDKVTAMMQGQTAGLKTLGTDFRELAQREMEAQRQQPVRKPDINAIAKDIFALKKLLFHVFRAQGVPLPPGILEEPRAGPDLKLPRGGFF